MKSKDLIMMITAIVDFLVGIGLTVAGFCVPPVGVISGSVLIAFW
jgi:hypothetical protein